MQPDTQTATINPVFAGYAAQQLQEATGGIDRVFDNLLEIARGNDPSANGYDRLRATRILYDRGFGKVTRNRPKMPTPESEKSGNHTNHSSDIPAPKTAAASNRPAAQLEQKLDDALGPPQAPDKPNPSHPERSAAESKDTPPIRLDEPGHIPAAPGYAPDLVREAQYYVLEITNYGAELAKTLAYIHEPDPEDTTIRACHRITAGLMIVDRVLGAVVDLEQPLDHWHDPSLEPNWGYKHPAEIDSSVPLEEIIEADRDARQFLEDYRQEADSPCEDCTDEYLCEFHDPKSELYEDPNDEEGLLMTARGMRNLKIFDDRLYFDENGLLRLHPPPPIDDS